MTTQPIPAVHLKIGAGLYGVTKVRWRDWPSRTWLSWAVGAAFLAVAITLCLLLSRVAPGEPSWLPVLRYTVTVLLVVLVGTRLILEGTVSKSLPGQPPRWDRQLADPWWTTIHTTTGLVLGVWLEPLILVAPLVVLWEVLEISVPGFGDDEINGNRLIDIAVALIGWVIFAIVADGHQIPIF